METVNCNLCGSANSRTVFEMPDIHFFPNEWFTVVECVQCGLGYLNPRPTFAEMGRYYPPEFYDYFEEDPRYHVRRYQREASIVLQAAAGRPGALLDIGCANGGFPRHMRHAGWSVEGVEVSQSSRAVTDLKVYQSAFPDIPVLEPSYDAVTAWAVLEHVHDPMSYFRKAAQVLRPNGTLIFLVTNFKSASSRALFREDPPRHLYYFTEPSVRRYLNETGLVLERAHYSNRIYSMRPINWLRSLIQFRALGRRFEWRDASFCREAYFKSKGIRPSAVDSVRFLATHPVICLDRVLMPLYEKIQILTRTYGIVTYVARKPNN